MKELSIQRISGIVTGLGFSKKVNGGVYTEMLIDFYLPDTDEEYENSDIEYYAAIFQKAPEMLEILKSIISNNQVFGDDSKGRKICRIEKKDFAKIEGIINQIER